jgi:hypothetical protein
MPSTTSSDQDLIFHGDHAFFADFVHRISNDLANGFVAVRRDRTDLCDFFDVVVAFEAFFSALQPGR